MRRCAPDQRGLSSHPVDGEVALTLPFSLGTQFTALTELCKSLEEHRSQLQRAGFLPSWGSPALPGTTPAWLSGCSCSQGQTGPQKETRGCNLHLQPTVKSLPASRSFHCPSPTWPDQPVPKGAPLPYSRCWCWFTSRILPKCISGAHPKR